MQSKCIVYPWSGTVSQYLQSSIYPLKRGGNSFMWPVLTLIKLVMFNTSELILLWASHQGPSCQYEPKKTIQNQLLVCKIMTTLPVM
jgi:hypothetical protein